MTAGLDADYTPIVVQINSKEHILAEKDTLHTMNVNLNQILHQPIRLDKEETEARVMVVSEDEVAAEMGITQSSHIRVVENMVIHQLFVTPDLISAAWVLIKIIIRKFQLYEHPCHKCNAGQ